ncbi:hypothetical protein Sliba_79170 [Streptomyces nigrescens]|uniref:Uncharacterized protein n=1 Tax=Streptomyces nigrescens TaxID=1920 RepID=A0A640TWB5_STRNI|nr:hypothetical protein Sliba_79170 [Streptomyces libani subsp. libani]GGV96064.1 hypothetical protein GCM10010500_37900 [Streptomyces libani subsp. libani]
MPNSAALAHSAGWAAATHPRRPVATRAPVKPDPETDARLGCVDYFGGVCQCSQEVVGCRAVDQHRVRSLSHTLKQERGGSTGDDATLFLIEWRGAAADHLAVLE